MLTIFIFTLALLFASDGSITNWLDVYWWIVVPLGICVISAICHLCYLEIKDTLIDFSFSDVWFASAAPFLKIAGWLSVLAFDGFGMILLIIPAFAFFIFSIIVATPVAIAIYPLGIIYKTFRNGDIIFIRKEKNIYQYLLNMNENTDKLNKIAKKLIKSKNTKYRFIGHLYLGNKTEAIRISNDENITILLENGFKSKNYETIDLLLDILSEKPDINYNNIIHLIRQPFQGMSLVSNYKTTLSIWSTKLTTSQEHNLTRKAAQIIIDKADKILLNNLVIDNAISPFNDVNLMIAKAMKFHGNIKYKHILMSILKGLGSFKHKQEAASFLTPEEVLKTLKNDLDTNSITILCNLSFEAADTYLIGLLNKFSDELEKQYSRQYIVDRDNIIKKLSVKRPDLLRDRISSFREKIPMIENLKKLHQIIDEFKAYDINSNLSEEAYSLADVIELQLNTKDSKDSIALFKLIEYPKNRINSWSHSYDSSQLVGYKPTGEMIEFDGRHTTKLVPEMESMYAPYIAVKDLKYSDIQNSYTGKHTGNAYKPDGSLELNFPLDRARNRKGVIQYLNIVEYMLMGGMHPNKTLLINNKDMNILQKHYDIQLPAQIALHNFVDIIGKADNPKTIHFKK